MRQEAHAKVRRAVDAGVLPNLKKVPIKCADCYRRATEYDHRDYGKPLDVEPVCSSCNKLRGPGKAMLKQKDRAIEHNVDDKMVVAGVNMRKSIWRIADDLAQEEGRSRSSMIAEIIKRYADQGKAKKSN